MRYLSLLLVQNINQTCTLEHFPQTRQLISDPQLQRPQLTECNTNGGNILVKCLKPSTDMETFDDLRIAAFDSHALKMDFESDRLHLN